MAGHPTADELMKRLLATREAGDATPASPEQLRLLRELTRDAPTFAPALLELARLLQLAEEPGVDPEVTFTEVQRLLEQSVSVSRRNPAALVELGYFLDVIRGREDDAMTLWEEGSSHALKTLEQAWAGMLRGLGDTRTKESLEKGLRLAERAEKVFPDSPRLLDEVELVREYARQDGLMKPASEP
ncbi:hypothetical protein HUA74_06780 [Myxococcus sp. CA051A]|uniref:Tetratricopeptide repeat protein n=1 Tax=Myxococcus llanfairpwllgwyngyllgogerychwyrndrobwllllantysiliogogogochensis TaxID=2590453 RepID=A0A540X9H5_9BACT|nr:MULTISPECIES: hypothetical protein [Myxococcus]NTX02665.1 hypothetical protein [Myxococcus sp. CA040A]NTX11087.1 hypothetical protein [Myxococcus sp. CA056]NTX34823.1 hypothetical protein [Myxococcus sp. CA033]NTX51765.1 hypothetical protein [Myxococcus sp. CA039A]NTX60360.1 hypothetical protein [Myxococcus sp. CA051A]